MKKIHVAHVTFDMRIGGAEQVIRNLVENTDPEKYDLSIICLEGPVGPLGVMLKDKGFRLISFDRKPGFDTRLIRNLREYITRENVDILHCHQYTPYVYGVSAALFSGCRVIFTEHGRFYPDERKLKRVLLNPVLERMTSRITAISRATKNALIKFENFPPKSIDVIYNGLADEGYQQGPDRELQKELHIEEHAFCLGTVARLDPIKNQIMMIKALKKIHASFPDTYLIIVGDGPERAVLEAAVKELQLQDYVIFAGYRNDTYRYYSIMDVFLLTSFSEGTAMTLLEAMASSLPCVATNVGGNPEIVEDKVSGILIPNNDEEALVSSIFVLLEKESVRKGMGQAGRQRFEELYSVGKMVHSYEVIYDGLAGWREENRA